MGQCTSSEKYDASRRPCREEVAAPGELKEKKVVDDVVVLEVMEGAGVWGAFVEEAEKDGAKIRGLGRLSYNNGFRDISRSVTPLLSGSFSIKNAVSSFELIVNLIQETTPTTTTYSTIVSQGNIISPSPSAYQNFTKQSCFKTSSLPIALHQFKVLMFNTTEFIITQCQKDIAEQEDEEKFLKTAKSSLTQEGSEGTVEYHDCENVWEM
eukprot:TRINITY_DN1344_c1_g1_i2.p1 TRINITY_DN1344_c1_g1~~TRINITY_DN1344_c1_g1_i2.p1  ORF type:complete len:210 (+),score=51.89 TRINITY_DN1344_c1_g1_i2:57-686(+)